MEHASVEFDLCVLQLMYFSVSANKKSPQNANDVVSSLRDVLIFKKVV